MGRPQAGMGYQSKVKDSQTITKVDTGKMVRTSSPVTGSATLSPPPSGAKDLQERLHVLLTRLAKTTDLIKTWPESDGDDASIHVETTTKLITAVVDVVSALEKVEGVIKADAALKKSLHECKVPINLLDLLDHGNGLNPGKRIKETKIVRTECDFCLKTTPASIVLT